MTSAIAQWLKDQERRIVPAWIAAIQHATLPSTRGPRTRHMESAQLIKFFDAIVVATETGETSELDASIQVLVSNRLGSGYPLGYFLEVAKELKALIWMAARDSLCPQDALDALAVLEPTFAHSVSRLAWLASRAAAKQLEEELEHTRYTLAKLDRTKSDFINVAAHELKTPLTLIQGYSAILSSELTETRQLHGALQGLTNGIQRLQGLVQDMIDVALIDSNVLAISYQRVSLHEIIRLAVSDLEREIAHRHLTINLEPFPSDLGASYLDLKRIYQAFTNLISNAVKYTPDNGLITVETQLLTDETQGLRFIKVSISDTGIGIARDDLPHIFDKFYRVGELRLHSTSKTKFKGGGPGLGLAITKGIVKAHGGRIWAESPGYDEENCPGSVFHVMLPVYTEPPQSPTERLLGMAIPTTEQSEGSSQNTR